MSFLNPIDLSIHHKHEWVIKIDKLLEPFINRKTDKYDFDEAVRVHGKQAIDACAVVMSTGVNADHFYIEKHFQELVLAAAETCPDDAQFTPEIILTPYGWAEFAEPATVISDDDGKPYTFSIAAWFATEHKVLFTCFTKVPAMDNLIFVTSFPFGMDTDKPYLKFFYSLMYLMGTKIAGIRREKTTRPKLQKIAAKSHTLRDVNVVVLRRTYQQGEPTGNHHNMSHDFQWTVCAHWRKQPYKSTGEVRPILIDSYLKGPADKPVRSKTNIFVARR